MSKPDDVALGLLVMYVADMYKMYPTTITPPVDVRISENWTVLGYLTATDAVFRKGLPTMAKGQEVCYGILAKNKNNKNLQDEFVVVLRGTEGITEWIEDAEFRSIKHPVGVGRVEQGFWEIYDSMRLKTTAATVNTKASDDIAAKIPKDAKVTVIGHSLGSALATYLTYDLAKIDRGSKWVSARLFASPHPGDSVFATDFDNVVGFDQYLVYDYSLDAVPRIPYGPDYSHLLNVIDLRPSEVQARIRFELLCNHHIVCYCAMLDYDQTDKVKKLDIDTSCSGCIKGSSSSFACVSRV